MLCIMKTVSGWSASKRARRQMLQTRACGATLLNGQSARGCDRLQLANEPHPPSAYGSLFWSISSPNQSSACLHRFSYGAPSCRRPREGSGAQQTWLRGDLDVHDALREGRPLVAKGVEGLLPVLAVAVLARVFGARFAAG